MNLTSRLFRPPQPVPEQHRRNFFHLYMDVFWFGVLNGSTLVFLSIYATRAGATPEQMGFLSAAPAVMNLIFTLPAGLWVRRFSTHKATCWAWVITRIFYLLLIPLPILLPETAQVWTIILITFIMSIPGTVAAIIGNVFFAETVPEEWRGQVVGTRNALLAAATMIVSLISGQILIHVSYPLGYQIVFGIGFVGAALSCLNLFMIHPLSTELKPATLEAIQRLAWKSHLRFEILRGPFGRILLLLFAYNLSVFIGQPIFPLYQVHALHFTDQTISLGTGIFWVVYFLGSTSMGSLGRRIGHQAMTALGVLLTSVSVVLFIFSDQPILYALNNIIGGLGWAFLGGGVINYLLERVPSDDRTPYLTWYNLAINAASLIGALLGSSLASSVGLLSTLIFVVFTRMAAGAAILRWGNPPQIRQTPTLPVLGIEGDG